MVYSMPFYKGSLSIQLLSQFKSINYRKRTLGSLLMPSLIGLGEHKYPFQVSDKEKDPVSQSILKYKIKYYYDVLSDYFFKKYNISIDDSKIKDIDPRISNHIVRTTRWLRTVGNFHQQFHNASHAENVNKLTPYSEGPIANVLFNWQIGVLDILSVKRYSQKYIESKFGMSYSHLRRKALGDNTIAFFLKSLIPFKSTLKRLLFKSKHVSDTNNTIGMKDLHNLRAISVTRMV